MWLRPDLEQPTCDGAVIAVGRGGGGPVCGRKASHSYPGYEDPSMHRPTLGDRDRASNATEACGQ